MEKYLENFGHFIQEINELTVYPELAELIHFINYINILVYERIMVLCFSIWAYERFGISSYFYNSGPFY